MASAHIDKRPNLNAGPMHTSFASQASITCFFQPVVPANYNPLSFSQITNGSTPPAISIPALPTNVQSNLLTVGMRIRKSIPEGHKTGSAYNAFSMLSESPVSPRTIPALCQANHHAAQYSSINAAMAMSGHGLGIGHFGPSQGMHHPQGVHTPFNLGSGAHQVRARSRELTPFCGLLKVGGWGIQEDSSSVAVDLDAVDMPPLSSQSSTTTVDSMSTFGGGDSGYCSWDGSAYTPALSMGLQNQTNKRRWEDDGEETEEGCFNNATVITNRAFKVPRKLKAEAGGMLGARREGDADFGEAPFLDYAHVEVEMGGA